MSAKVLIVDDEPDLLRLVSYGLKVEGYQIVTATTGEDALRKVQKEQPDLIILDMMLPDMSGIDICQQLRAQPKLGAVPIIMLTARTELVDKIKGLRAGADEYVTKPFERDELVARVAALLERTKRIRQVEPQRQGKVIAFIGAKGGVGTTTVALNVAFSLMKQDRAVIAAELRSYYGTFASQLALMPQGTLADVLRLDTWSIDSSEVSRRLIKHPSGLQVLCGPQKAADFKEIKPEAAEAVVKALAGLADYTILDLPSHPFPANRAALKLCDAVVIVVEPELGAVSAGKMMMEVFQSWDVSGPMIRAAVVNRTGSSHSMQLSDIRAQMGCKIVGIMTRVPDLAMRGEMNMGKPLVLADPTSIAAVTLVELAGRLATDQVIAV